MTVLKNIKTKGPKPIAFFNKVSTKHGRHGLTILSTFVIALFKMMFLSRTVFKVTVVNPLPNGDLLAPRSFPLTIVVNHQQSVTQ
jgi:hypothetical protein